MINNAITRMCLGAATLLLCSCAYSPQPGGNTDVTSPRDSHNTKDSHDVTTVTMAPGSTYAPTIMKGSDNGNENDGYARYDGYRFDPGATRFAPGGYGVVRVAPNCNPYFPGY